jgi:outer membrane protein TolC
MTPRIYAAALLVLVSGASAGAQSTSQIIAQTSGPFSGSVTSGPATAEPLPLTLADAIERGLKHNLGLISIEQQVESARGSRLRTLRELMPRVDARMGDTAQTTNLAAFGFDSSVFPGIPSIVGPFNIFDARVAGSQTVFDLAALNDVRSKTATLNAARLDSLNARETVVFVITNLYFQAIAGENRIQTARSQVTTAEALLAQANALRNAGAAPGIDVVRAQVQVQSQRQRLISAETEFARQTIQLVRAIGVPTAQRIDLADRTLSLAAPSLTLDAAVARAASARADYQASLERVHAAESSLQAAKTDLVPSVHVNGDFGAIGSAPGDARRTYSLSANVRVPLFDQDRRGREVENAAALRQRQSEAADLAQRIEAEVRTAFLDVQAAEQQLAVARERVSLAGQELSLARTRFTAGVTNNLEVIQAQDEVAAASDIEVAATYAVNVARAGLVRTLGPADTSR